MEAVASAGCQLAPARPTASRPATPSQTVETWFDAATSAEVFTRDAIRPGEVLCGPAILCEPSSTTVIDPGWQGEVLSGGELLLTDVLERAAGVARKGETDSDP